MDSLPPNRFMPSNYTYKSSQSRTQEDAKHGITHQQDTLSRLALICSSGNMNSDIENKFKMKQLKEHMAPISRIHEFYSSPPSLLWQFPAITEMPRLRQIHKDTCQLQAWFWSLDQQILITASEQQRESDRYNSLYTQFRGPTHTDPGGWICYHFPYMRTEYLKLTGLSF